MPDVRAAGGTARGPPAGRAGLRRVKPKQLLEVLLLEQGRFVPEDRAADLLWGERPPRRAAATIETYVSLLRRRLDSGSGLGRRLILTEPGGYRLAADALEVDLDSYEALLRHAAVAAPADRRTARDGGRDGAAGPARG